jgi:type VI secretion system protein ImpE
MNAHELFHAGKLREAIAAVVEEVRQRPTDASRRLLLAELICFTGDLERADKHLDAVGHQDPEALPWIQVFRHLIRAEEARQQHFAEGRLPEFLAPPEEVERLLLEGSIRLREGSITEAAEIFAQAEAARPRVSGSLDEQPFDDIRDLDDRTASILEVLTSSGHYYWVPLARVESIEFVSPERPRDLLWRQARLIVRGGPDGEVYIPALYAGSASRDDDAIRLGRLTDWEGGDNQQPARGLGQRIFLVGDDAIPILELGSLTFDPPAETADTPTAANAPS